MKRLTGLLVVGLIMAASVAVGGPAEAAPVRFIPAAEKAIPNQYIVVLKDGANPRSIAATAGIRPKYVYEAALNGFAATLNVGQLNALQHHPDVDYVEQDAEVSTATTQLSAPWGLDRIDQRALPLNGTYTFTSTGTGVHAYIIDSGIYAGHPDFGGRARNVYDAFGGTGADCNGHGSHIAGIIGGAQWGVAKGVQLRGVRVIDCLGNGTLAGVIAGIDYVRVSGVRPAVANMSVSGSYSTAVNNALTNLINSGINVAVAAGNNNADACSYSPSSVTAALVVAATDRTDTRASFSNYGACVDLYAPGVSITSTWYTGGTNVFNGTSMSAAHVTGCAAKYLAGNPTASPATIHSWIIDNATVGVVKSNPVNTPNRLLYCPL